MLIPTRFALLLSAALALSACAGGFKPLYGNDSGAAEKLASLSVSNQNNRAGQLTRNEILDGAKDETPTYRLSLNVTESISEISRFSSSSAVRMKLTLRGVYEMHHSGTNKVLATGQAIAKVEYDLIKVPVSDLQVVEHARLRASKLLGQDIKQRLAANTSSHTD